MEVPKEVLKMAEDNGYNSVKYIGVRNGFEAYGIGVKDDKGRFVPMGLPATLLRKGQTYEIKIGFDY